MTSLAEAALDTSSAAPASAGEAARFVINLCSSTTPMSLVQPKTEELRRFTFFVSRRREEGRERFRLHMGYFATAEEGEAWLSAVRDVYPGAWVGEAPGKKLRGAAAEAARRAPIVSAPPPAMNLLFDDAAPAPVAMPAAVPAVPKPVAVAKPVPDVQPVAVTKPAAVAQLVAAPAAAPMATPVVAPVVAKAPVPAPKSAAIDTTSLSNVREVIAALDFDAPAAPANVPTLSAHVPTSPSPKATSVRAKAAVASATVASPAAKVVPPAPKVEPAAVKIAPPPPKPLAAPATLSDSQVLRVLEERRAEGSAPSASDSLADTAIALVRPEDTQTLRALKADLQCNAPAQFAVQLDWSVTPLDIAKVPPLAIFGAYTLYTVETNRDGRTWYGLRLGFFSDALSAKQVAYYVRSDFASVSVVPVSAMEKSNATADSHDAAAVGTSMGTDRKASEEFKLFDLEPAAPRVLPGVTDAASAAASAAAPQSTAIRPSRRPARANARTGNAEDSLEQTLEILGASDLAIDNGRGELLNDSGVRHLSVKVDKRTSTFSKLLDRLSDRIGGR